MAGDNEELQPVQGVDPDAEHVVDVENKSDPNDLATDPSEVKPEAGPVSNGYGSVGDKHALRHSARFPWRNKSAGKRATNECYKRDGKTLRELIWRNGSLEESCGLPPKLVYRSVYGTMKSQWKGTYQAMAYGKEGDESREVCL